MSCVHGSGAQTAARNSPVTRKGTPRGAMVVMNLRRDPPTEGPLPPELQATGQTLRSRTSVDAPSLPRRNPAGLSAPGQCSLHQSPRGRRGGDASPKRSTRHKRLRKSHARRVRCDGNGVTACHHTVCVSRAFMATESYRTLVGRMTRWPASLHANRDSARNVQWRRESGRGRRFRRLSTRSVRCRRPGPQCVRSLLNRSISGAAECVRDRAQLRSPRFNAAAMPPASMKRRCSPRRRTPRGPSGALNVAAGGVDLHEGLPNIFGDAMCIPRGAHSNMRASCVVTVRASCGGTATEREGTASR